MDTIEGLTYLMDFLKYKKAFSDKDLIILFCLPNCTCVCTLAYPTARKFLLEFKILLDVSH